MRYGFLSKFAVALALVLPATASDVDNNFQVVRLRENINYVDRVTLVPANVPLCTLDQPTQVYKMLQLPNLPYFSPYNPNDGARVNLGIVSFPLLARLPGAYIGNLPESLKKAIIAQKVAPQNVTIAIVTQDIPFVDTMPLCLRPHGALIPDAVSTPPKNWAKTVAINTGIFEGERPNIRYKDCALGTLMKAQAITHESGGSNVLSPKNMEIVGVDHKHPGSFYTFSSFREGKVKNAFVCLHVLLNDQQTAALRASMDMLRDANCTRDFLMRRLDLLNKNPAFENNMGLRRIMDLMQAPNFQAIPAPAPKQQKAFNARNYLSNYPHVSEEAAKKGINPEVYAQQHYTSFKPHFPELTDKLLRPFNAARYLEKYPHVRAEAERDGVNPEVYAQQHFKKYKKHFPELSDE